MMLPIEYMPWELRVSATPKGSNAPYHEVVAEDEDMTEYLVPGLTMIGRSWVAVAAHIVAAHNFWLQEGGA